MTQDDIQGAAARPPDFPLRPGQLLGMARGFAWLSVGLLVTFMLLLGLLEWHLPQFLGTLPPCLAGAGLALYGGLLWWRTSGPDGPWRRHAQIAVFLTALQIYLAPFALWWRRDLPDLQLFSNTMTLLASLPALAWVIARQAEDTGRMLGDHALAVEARFGRRALIFPVLLLTVLVAGYEGAILAGVPLPEPPSIAMPGLVVPPWLVMLQLGAILMSMSIGWRCTHACQRALIQAFPPPVTP